jgi:hypothetical protein
MFDAIDPPAPRPDPTMTVKRLNEQFPPTLDAHGAEIEHECFACHYMSDDRVPPVAVDAYNSLKLLVQALDSGTCSVVAAQEIALFYETRIREPGNRFLREGARPFPEWPVRTVYTHYGTPYHRRNDARASVRQRTHVLEEVVYTISNSGLFSETRGYGTPVRSVNYEVLDAFLKANSALNQMYRMDMNKLAGAGSGVAVPAQTASNTLMGPDRVHAPMGTARIRSVLTRQ